MRKIYTQWVNALSIIVFGLSIIFTLLHFEAHAQSDGVTTYTNLVLPGSHSDQTLLKVGNYFYTAESSFHWTLNFQILHSTNLVHWDVISNVVSPNWSGLVGEDGPKDVAWQGAIAYFDNKYWAFFFIHGKGQYFSTATNPRGSWTTPTLVRGSIGYDNAVFVDDDGRAYMLMKNGQGLNRIQELGRDGQLTGPVLNMDWINCDHRFSWAEGQTWQMVTVPDIDLIEREHVMRIVFGLYESKLCGIQRGIGNRKYNECFQRNRHLSESFFM